jgi:CubicO group peptidase (beta-lactamase class C family)
MLHRRGLLLSATALMMADGVKSQQSTQPKGWEFAPPENAGFRSDMAERLEQAYASGELRGLHGVVVTSGGRIILERYFKGQDEAWGRDLGEVSFGPETQHDLRSVTKSIVGLLYGIALSEGLVPSLDTPVLDAFPAYRDLAGDPRRKQIRIAHVLSMTLGTEWNEDLPYTDPRNSEIAMEHATDRYRFVLDRPLVADAGQRWIYCGGATAILGHLIAKGAGRPLLEYARDRLFAPLGIDNIVWTKGSNGEESAASGLRLLPRDLARIGQMILDGGRNLDRQIIPADWIKASMTPRVSGAFENDYGYHWYLGKLRRDGQPWMAAYGNGGQRLILVPHLGLTTVIAAGNYNQPDQWRMPLRVFGEFILGALKG